MPNPGDQPAGLEEEAEKRRAAHRDLVRAYKRLFSTEDGRRILADLADKFGEDKQEYVYGCTPQDHAFRTGLRQHLRYIRKMTDTVLKPMGEKPTKRTAKSGLQPS